MEKIVVYTDGGSRGNPGPAGAGVAPATRAPGFARRQRPGIKRLPGAARATVSSGGWGRFGVSWQCD